MNNQPSLQSISTLKRVIHDAFDDVRLGRGVGLWEGQAIDDYQGLEFRQQAKSRDEKHLWHKLTAEDLNQCASSLSFFDAEGMRFHLPAYMMLEIEGLFHTGCLIFHLTHSSEYMMDNFSGLDQFQRDAVYDFLRWCSYQPDYELDRDDIKKAMDSYWSIPR